MKEEWYNQSNEDNLRERVQELESKVLSFGIRLNEWIERYDSIQDLIKDYEEHFDIRKT